MKKYFIVLAAALAFAGPVAAQQLKVSTGSPTGTYSKMFKELTDRCSAEGLSLIEEKSSGSVENIDRLINNQVNMGFVQSDVIWLKARDTDLGNVKTLIALHPEEVHFVALTNKKVGGTMGFGGNQLTNIEQLSDLTVGAVGGSFMTAQVIRLQTEIHFKLAEFGKNEDMLAALAAGKIDAAILVGGSPLGAVQALDGNYTLLTITDATVGKLKNVYRPAKVTYSKLNNGRAVNTIATDALVVTREYKTEKTVKGLSSFRQCFYKNLDELKETTGTHPKWQAVDPENKGKWAWYQLPEVTAIKASVKK